MIRRLAALLAVAFVGACGGDDGDDGDQRFRIPVTIETAAMPLVFQAELADSASERQRGLMGRTSMGLDQGMLFLFEDEAERAFWMKDTLIPLDMIFIRADRTILGIVDDAEPETTLRRSVPGESQFVLEINGGIARSSGIEPGQLVTFTATVPAG